MPKILEAWDFKRSTGEDLSVETPTWGISRGGAADEQQIPLKGNDRKKSKSKDKAKARAMARAKQKQILRRFPTPTTRSCC